MYSAKTEELSVVNARESKRSVYRPTTRGLCIVMVCTDMSEAEQVARRLLELNSGCLVTYRRAEDLLCNSPTGRVALIILATEEKPSVLTRTLKWLGHRWPGCPITVVGEAGSTDSEMAARQGGALYLTRPVAAKEWTALFAHVLGSVSRIDQREAPR